ncbi:MAG: c-type cytochrome [bacterium]
MLKFMRLFTLISLTLSASVAIAQDASEDKSIVEGKKIYEQKCAHCHGVEGKGDGSAAERLNPRPRDFTRGKYKIRSTESRQLPTDEDLLDVITKGMPGTSMPAWDNLSENDRRLLVAYIKTFSKRFELTEEPPIKLDLRNRVQFSQESIAKGRQVYEEIECVKCHGEEGRGDGPSALDLVDEWDEPTRPADLTESWTFRGGSSAEDIYKRFIAGLDGTPMPSIVGSFVMDEEIEDIQIKIEDEEPLTDEEREKFEQAMQEIRVKSWHLANYVRSLAPEEKPEVEIVLKSKSIEGELPQEIDDPRWDEIESNMYPLAGQVIVEPRNFTPSVDAVFVKSMYNDDEIAFLLAWDDPSMSLASPTPVDTSASPDSADSSEQSETTTNTEQETPTTYDDAIALQFPVKLSDGPERPYFLMGDARKSVYLWHLKASNSFDAELQAAEKANSIEANAKGMTELTKQPAESQNVFAKISYSNGRYRLLAKRSLSTEDKNDLQFEVGKFVPIAFFAWDGSSGETGTQCAVSTWYYLHLEKPASNRRFFYAPIALILAVAFEIFVRKSLRRRASE